jgi:23S rRNA pseudouridine2605 synthase
MRLDQRLMACELGSRREVTALLRDGAVTVDGVTVTDPGFGWESGMVICCEGREIAIPAMMLAWHKPAGVLTTVRDPWGRDGLEEALPREVAELWHPVGRLDRDTHGLLLLSRSGVWTQRLLHPRRAVEREYVAIVEGAPRSDLGEVLAAGVDTTEGVFPARLVSVEGQAVRLVVQEGKHRMVRRLLANVGLPVTDLRRVRYGAVHLGDLPPGEWRDVSREELAEMWPGGPGLDEPAR